jgi:DNA-binding transcriptional ArsR family regulator
MNAEADIAGVAALIADRARAAMLDALMDRRALSSGELARLAGVSPATASIHLKRLLDGGLVEVEPHGRHRYYRLAGEMVAQALEALGLVARPLPVRSLRQSQTALALRYARTCYDHLAGVVGVALTRALLAAGALAEHDHFQLSLTPAGDQVLAGFGVDVEALRRQRRPLARGCLDWTERAPHLAGAAGAALLARMLELGWLTPSPFRRGLIVTAAGHAGLADAFRCVLPSPAA